MDASPSHVTLSTASGDRKQQRQRQHSSVAQASAQSVALIKRVRLRSAAMGVLRRSADMGFAGPASRAMGMQDCTTLGLEITVLTRQCVTLPWMGWQCSATGFRISGWISEVVAQWAQPTAAILGQGWLVNSRRGAVLCWAAVGGRCSGRPLRRAMVCMSVHLCAACLRQSCFTPSAPEISTHVLPLHGLAQKTLHEAWCTLPWPAHPSVQCLRAPPHVHKLRFIRVCLYDVSCISLHPVPTHRSALATHLSTFQRRSLAKEVLAR